MPNRARAAQRLRQRRSRLSLGQNQSTPQQGVPIQSTPPGVEPARIRPEIATRANQFREARQREKQNRERIVESLEQSRQQTLIPEERRRQTSSLLSGQVEQVQDQARDAGRTLNRQQAERFLLQNADIPERQKEPEKDDRNIVDFVREESADLFNRPISETAEQAKTFGQSGLLSSVSGGLGTAFSRLLARVNERGVEAQEDIGTAVENITRGKITSDDVQRVVFDQVPDLIRIGSENLKERAEKDQELAAVLSNSVEDPNELVRLVAQNLPNLAATYGSGLAIGALTRSPQAGFATTVAVGSGIEGGAARNEAVQFLENSDDPELRKLAKDDDFLDTLGGAVGVVNGTLDAIPFFKFFRKAPGASKVQSNIQKNVIEETAKKLAKGSGRAARQAFEEGGTEFIQEVVGNVAKRTYDENQEYFEGADRAALAGILLGGGTSVTTDVVSSGVRGGQEVARRTRALAEEVGGERGFARVPGQQQDGDVQQDNIEATPQQQEAVNQQQATSQQETTPRPPSAQRITGQEPSPMVETRQRESTRLKNKLQQEQTASRRGAREGTRVERQAQQAIKKEEIQSLKRTGQLKQLKQRIKDRFQFINRGIREGTVSTKKEVKEVQNEIIGLIEESLPANERGKFLRTIKNIQTRDQFIKNLPRVQQMVDRVANANEIRNLSQQIRKEVKKGKPRVGEKKALESRFGPEAQRTLDFLRGKAEDPELRTLLSKTSRKTVKGNIKMGLDGDRAAALQEIEATINQYGTVDENGVMPEVPPEVTERLALLNMVGIQDMSASELAATFNNIKSLKENGRLKVLLDRENKTAEIERIRDVAVDEFGTKEDRPVELGEVGREINPVSRVIEMMENVLLSERGLTRKMTFSKETARVSEWSAEKIRIARNGHTRFSAEFTNRKVRKMKEIFGEKKISKTLRQLNKRDLVFDGKDATGKTLNLSQMEAAYWWGQAQDPTMISTFEDGMNFTPEMFQALENYVRDDVKQYVEWLQSDWLKTIRARANERYKQKFGMNMPNNEFYLPISRAETPQEKEVTNLLVGESFPSHASTVPSSAKTRTGSIAPLRKISVEQIMRRHMEDMNQFIHFDEAISDLRRVYNNEEVRNTVFQQRGGKERHGTLMNKIDDIARGGAAAKLHIAALDWAIGNFTKASMMLNFVPFFKQFTSLPAFTIGQDSVSYGELGVGSALYFKNPVFYTKKFVNGSDMVFERLTKGFNRETALAFKRGDKDFTIKEVNMSLGKFLSQAVYMPTRGGDMVPILPGMTAKYLQARKKLEQQGNLTEEQIEAAAIREAENLTTRTQQSQRIEDQGRIQTAGSLGRAAAMYSTTPIQYFRETTLTARQWYRGQVSTRVLLRTIMTTWIILPALFQWVSDGLPGVLGDWEEENTFRMVRSLLLGPINYYPAAGNLIGTYYDAFAHGETWKNVATSISPLFSAPIEGQDALATLSGLLFDEGMSESKRQKEWAQFAEEMYKTIAMTTGAFPTNAPITVKGLNDLITGETSDPRRLIYSEWALGGMEDKTGNIQVGPGGGSGGGGRTDARSRAAERLRQRRSRSRGGGAQRAAERLRQRRRRLRR